MFRREADFSSDELTPEERAELERSDLNTSPISGIRPIGWQEAKDRLGMLIWRELESAPSVYSWKKNRTLRDLDWYENADDGEIYAVFDGEYWGADNWGFKPLFENEEQRNVAQTHLREQVKAHENFNPQTGEIEPPEDYLGHRNASVGWTGTGGGVGTETDVGDERSPLVGDLPANLRNVPDGQKYPVDEGDKYRNRDRRYVVQDGPAEDDYLTNGGTNGENLLVDVGELMGLDNLLHVTNAKRKNMKSDEILENFLREAGAGLSPSRTLHNAPANVLEEAAIRLERDAEELAELDGELGNEEHGTLTRLEEELEARGIDRKPPPERKPDGKGAGVRTAAPNDNEYVFEDEELDRSHRPDARDDDRDVGGSDIKDFELHLENQDRDDGQVLVHVDGPGAAAAAEHDQSIEGSHWESDDDDFAYALISDRPGLVAALEAEGYVVNADEYYEMDAAEWEELRRRHEGARVRTAADEHATTDERDVEDLFGGKGKHESKPEHEQEEQGEEMAEDENLRLISDALDDLLECDLEPDALRSAGEIRDAVDELEAIQEDEEGSEGEGEGKKKPKHEKKGEEHEASIRTAGSHDPIAYAYEAAVHCPGCAYERFGDKLDDPDAEDSEGNPIHAIFPWDETPPEGEHCADCHGEISPPHEQGEGDYTEHEGVFSGKSAAAWGRKLASKPVLVGNVSFGHLKVAAVAGPDVPFDLFEPDSEIVGSAARSLGAMAVNRMSERRMRFVPPSPKLIAEAGAILRKTMARLRGGYTVENLMLEGVDFAKVAQTDGTCLEGEMRWHMTLADHLRNRRGVVDAVVKIAGGMPIDAVALFAEGRPIAFTRAALDEHLNVRRDAGRSSFRRPHVERAVIEEY